MEVAISENDWQVIEKKYGVDVVRFLQSNNITPQKIGSCVYKLPNAAILDRCSKLADPMKQKVSMKKAKKRQRYPARPEITVPQNCYDLPENFKRIINIDEKTPKHPNECFVPSAPCVAPIPSNLQMSFDNLLKQRNKSTEMNFSRTRKADDESPEKLFAHMMKTDVGGSKKMVEYKNCSKDAGPVLEIFQKNHKKFKYFHHLETILTENDQRNNAAPEVSFCQLIKYFHLVLTRVVPRSLFGSNRNTKKIKQGLRDYANASWNETITLKKHIFTMDISRITWLKAITDEKTKWAILARVVKWFFERYFFAILKVIFHVIKDLHSEKKVFLSSLRWRKWKRSYFMMQESKGNIVRTNCMPDIVKPTIVPPASIKMFPKKAGVRSIIQLRIDEEMGRDLKVLKALLQQLYVHQYERFNPSAMFLALLASTETKNAKPKEKTYLVSADIRDAYGSVNQTKLYTIVHDAVNDVNPCELLPMKWLATLKPSSSGWRKNKIEYRYSFNFLTAPSQMKRYSLFTVATDRNHKHKLVRKEEMFSLLHALILRPTFRYKRTKYVLTRGIGQGCPISPILSEIYYAHMTREYFGVFMKSGTLLRFVDDFLYITSDEKLAKQFIKKTRHPISEYHCYFNCSKTETNVAAKFCKPSKSIKYLGYRIDSASLEVTPVYGNTTFRHLKSMQQIKYRNEMLTFTMRLMNFTSLKLSPNILDTRLNGPATIVSTAESVGQTMALRCVVLISKVFDRLEYQGPNIWWHIRHAVAVLVKLFIRRIHLRSRGERETLIRNIRISIWRSIYRVFAVKPCTRHHFGRPIKSVIMKLKTARFSDARLDERASFGPIVIKKKKS